MTGVHQESTFIVAETCANNVRSLKEIHVWADLQTFVMI